MASRPAEMMLYWQTQEAWGTLSQRALSKLSLHFFAVADVSSAHDHAELHNGAAIVILTSKVHEAQAA